MFYGNDQDILKVLKLNQDNCKNATDRAKALNASAESDILETEKFISDVEKMLGVDSSVAVDSQSEMSPSPKVSNGTISDWNEMVSEARTAYPEKLTVDDILTKVEYQNAMRHLDSINEKLSQRTGFRKVD